MKKKLIMMGAYFVSINGSLANNMASAAPATTITCWGCREDQPNQLAHMDVGGCLYTDPFGQEAIDEMADKMVDEVEFEKQKLNCISTVKSGRERKPPKRLMDE